MTKMTKEQLAGENKALVLTIELMHAELELHREIAKFNRQSPKRIAFRESRRAWMTDNTRPAFWVLEYGNRRIFETDRLTLRSFDKMSEIVETLRLANGYRA